MVFLKKSMIAILVVVGLVLIVGISAISGYNSMVSLRETVDKSYSTIDVQLKRRNDLIPNLVNTVKGYAAHETEAIDSVTNARAAMMGAGNQTETAQADQELTGALSRLMAISENYPDLKANQNFMQLSDELSGTENRIGVARQDYNDAARQYNTKIKSFPGNLFAGMLGFEQVSYFEASEQDKQTPVVEF